MGHDMTPDTLRALADEISNVGHRWRTELDAAAAAWEKQAAEDKAIIDVLKGAMVDVDEINGRLRKRLEEAEKGHWECGCGWVNGVNLAACAQCGRTPADLARLTALAGEEKRLTEACDPYEGMTDAERDAYLAGEETK